MFIVLKLPSIRGGEGGRSGPVIGLGARNLRWPMVLKKSAGNFQERFFPVLFFCCVLQCSKTFGAAVAVLGP